MKNTKKLYRDNKDVYIAGVASGLGDYFKIDPNILRLIFVIVTVYNGLGIVLYLSLWLVLPVKGSKATFIDKNIKSNIHDIQTKLIEISRNVSIDNKNKYNWLGILLIIVGLIFFSDVFYLVAINLFWPLIIVIVGILLLIKK